VEYLEFWVSDHKVSAECFVEDPLFTLNRRADGQLEGERPGGYYYAWIYQENGNEVGSPPRLKIESIE
jgi:hypothetical protein